ncbi:BTAD domain-containing putative transcriptional regulator [Streptomyces sp. NPDC088674]|uniref:BTAD domain-containing putative transcriptional regulator n=1 Tax=Streptomyces sp. NPDC088674 TaxID=3365869 RepID=UPI003809E877
MKYRILGATEAHAPDGMPVPLGGARLRSLLAALALRPGRGVAAGALVDEVWGGEPPRDAAAALQALVGRLRKALGHEALASGPGGYRLVAERGDVDLYRFEDLLGEGSAALDAHSYTKAAEVLRSALGLWRGPALADLPEAAAEARHAEDLRHTAVRRRVEADLGAGRAASLVPELRGLTAAHPYDERLHGLLLRALRADGRPADALAAYEDLRRTLAEHLGTDPGHELRALHAELLRETTGPAPAPAATPLPESPAPTTGIRRRLTSFVGRAREIESIRAALRTSRLVTLTGPGGSGKTRLAEEAALGYPYGNMPAPDEASRPLQDEAPRPHPGTAPHPAPHAAPRPTPAATPHPTADEAPPPGTTLPPPGGTTPPLHPHPHIRMAELAPLDRPEDVPAAVVSALGVRETVLRTAPERPMATADPVELLVEYCAGRELLLVLDNCEHVIEAAARLAETLLTRCPGLTVLATSREPLGVPGEAVRPVDPLPAAEAVRLFGERGAAVRPGFTVAEDADAVAEICRRLDGLPLAIELAAARLRLLGPRQLADRLDDRFRLLTAGSRTVLPRQQTLRAVVDWSWDLLDEEERDALRELSVFAGGWDLAAAEAVCAGPADLLVGALVDKSLVVASPEPDGTGMRFRMLETIHEYAVERAAEDTDRALAAGRRHTAYYRALVTTAEPLIRSGEQLPWIARLETELDNIRAALARALAAGEEEDAVALVLGCGWFWWLRNHRIEGAEWAERTMVLAGGVPGAVGDLHVRHRRAEGGTGRSAPTEPGPGVPPDDARYWPRLHLRMLHLFLSSETDPDHENLTPAARAYVTGLRDLFSGADAPEATVFPGLLAAFAPFFLDTAEDAYPLIDGAVDRCRRLGAEWELATALMFRVHITVDAPRENADAQADLGELRHLCARTGDRWLGAQVASARAELAMAQGRYDDARAECEEALHLAQEVGAFAETPFLLARLAEIAHHSGDRPRAEAHMVRAAAVADETASLDAHAFLILLRARMALEDGAPHEAEAMCAQLRVVNGRTGGPPTWMAAFADTEIRVRAALEGADAALPQWREALAAAVSARLSGSITASLLETGALLLMETGDHTAAVHALTIATRLRGPHARGPHEADLAARVTATTRAALGPAAHAEAVAGAASIDPADLIA